MAKLGNDWLFIGLGLGVLYLTSRIGKPTEKLADSVATIGGQVSDVTGATSGLLVDTIGALDEAILGLRSIPQLFADSDFFGNKNKDVTRNKNKDVTQGAPITQQIVVSDINRSLGLPNTTLLDFVLGKTSTPFNNNVLDKPTTKKSVVFNTNIQPTGKLLTTSDFAKIIASSPKIPLPKSKSVVFK